MSGDIEGLERRLLAQRQDAEERNRQIQAEAERVIKSIPRMLGNQPDFQDSTKPPVVITARQLGDGPIFYTGLRVGAPRLSYEGIQELGQRISDQQTAFSQLDSATQEKTRSEFAASSGKSRQSRPYVDFLRSEAFGERYRRLPQDRKG